MRLLLIGVLALGLIAVCMSALGAAVALKGINTASTADNYSPAPKRYNTQARPADGSCVKQLGGFYKFERGQRDYWYCDPVSGLIWNGNGYTCPQFHSGQDRHPMACFHRQMTDEIKSATDAGYYK